MQQYVPLFSVHSMPRSVVGGWWVVCDPMVGGRWLIWRATAPSLLDYSAEGVHAFLKTLRFDATAAVER